MTFKDKDKMYRFISECGSFRLSFTKSTSLVNTATQSHALTQFQSELLGELLISSCLSASLLKDEQVISFKMRNKQNKEILIAESGKTGEVRGYIQRIENQEDSNIADFIQKYLEDGTLHITHWKDRKAKNSYVKIDHRNLSNSICEYYLQSEQIPTYIKSSIIFDTNQKVKNSWGYILQLLPGFPKNKLSKLEEDLLNLSSPDNNFLDIDPTEELTGLLKHFKIKQIDKYPVDFFCRCSKKSFANSLSTLGEKELKEMATEGTQEINCHYCSEKYYFTPDDLQSLIIA